MEKKENEPVDPQQNLEEPVVKSLEKAIAKKNEGNLYFKSMNFEEALECYTEALEIVPDDAGKEDKATIHFNTAMTHTKMGDTDAAIEHYSAAIELNPNYGKALYQRSVAYQKKEDYGLALKDVKKLKELNFPGINFTALEAELEQKEKQKTEKMKTEALGQLKNLGNTILGKFGMNLDNFKLLQNPDGSYNISYQN